MSAQSALYFQAPPAPEEIKAILDLTKKIKPGMSAMIGTDESRGSARHVAFGYQLRLCIANLFITFSPDSAGTYFISIYANKISADDVVHKINLPTRNERKEVAGRNPVLQAVYAKRILEIFIEHFLGWDQKRGVPYREGGACGVLEWFTGAAEAQKCQDIHFHILGGVRGWPRTTAEFRELIKSERFRKRCVIYYFDANFLCTFL